MAKQLSKIASELEDKNTPFVWATVVNVKGSAPRHLGSKMIITQDETFGTIGGGALEHQVTKDAREQLSLREPKTINYPLGPLLGQCCGGEVDVFIEPISPVKKIIVFGAGHISEKLCPMLSELNFNITLVDERRERIDLPVFDIADEKLNEFPDDALKTIDFTEDLFIIALTHEHKHDEAIVEYCLDKPIRYLGMIGSKKKWTKFKERYRSKGFKDKQISRVKSPIGLDIKSETPFEIAVSIIAELISLK